MAALKCLSRLLAPVFLVVGLCAPAMAQTEAAATVEVRAVKFSTISPSAGGAAWLEAAVELDIRMATGGGPYARYVDRVQVALSLAIDKRAGGFDFFRSSVETVALEAGRAVVRFYLPPEVVKREQINTDPQAWLVELTGRGRTPVSSGSASLRSAEALRSFRDRVVQAAPANDGVLVPQHESPFATDYAGNTPSVIRRTR